MAPAFLDANIPIYAAGSRHPLKEPCHQVLELVAKHSRMFVTNAEVLQELLHRYVALRMWPHPGMQVFERFALLMRDRVEPIRGADVEEAAILAGSYPQLSARDLVHAAVMTRLGLTQIVSADIGFDGIAGIERLDPAKVRSWSKRVIGV